LFTLELLPLLLSEDGDVLTEPPEPVPPIMPPEGLLPLSPPPPLEGFEPRELPDDGETEPLSPERGLLLEVFDLDDCDALATERFAAVPDIFAPPRTKDGKPFGPLYGPSPLKRRRNSISR
jgi:hypothetical protein